MGYCLSDDLRIRVVSEVEKGCSRRAAAARFGVSVSSAIRWVQGFRQTGSAEAKPQGGDRRSKADRGPSCLHPESGGESARTSRSPNCKSA